MKLLKVKIVCLTADVVCVCVGRGGGKGVWMCGGRYQGGG